VCTVKNSWWWTEELSETCRVSFQNKFEKLMHLVGFIIRNITHCVNMTKQHKQNRLQCCDKTRYFSWDIPREEFTELAIRLPWWPLKTENAPGRLLLGFGIGDEKPRAECAMPRRNISKLKQNFHYLLLTKFCTVTSF